MLKDMLKKVAAPGSGFRGAPFWAWNGKLEPSELREQIRLMHRMGLGGFFMHSRVGLDTAYLSPEWFDCVRACVDEAEKLGMQAWLYDEDRWPSGAAGGLVTQDHRYRMRYLVMQSDPAAPDAGEVVARFAVVLHGGGYRSYRRVQAGARLKKDETLCRFAVQVAEDSSWYNGQAYLDTLNPEAVQTFIAVTHEAYRREIGDAFGKTVPGIFSDEPNYYHHATAAGIPWTAALPDRFRQKYGYDLLDRLPELFLLEEEPLFSHVRLAYRDLITDLFVQAFSRQIGAWCEQNNLQLTGHVLAEDTLTGQTTVSGSVMRFYEYMQAPGIDLLTERWNIFNTAKQCVSMARQFGRRVRLSETYGCTGWDFPFAGHKALGDWQAALGITLRCQHLAWYTMAGEAKRDYPASISYQSPWAEDYTCVEEYFARLGAALSEGEEVRDLLVVNPIESLWGMFTPEAAMPAEGDLRRADNDAYVQLTNQLLSLHLDFDLGEEEVMSRHAAVEGDTLRVGQAVYRAVLLPRMRTIRASTLDLLEIFRRQGGTVAFLGSVPELMDGLPSPRPAAVYTAFRDIEDKALHATLSPAARRISLQLPDGSEAPSILYQLRQGDDFSVLFLCNTAQNFSVFQMNASLVRDRKLAYPHVTLEWKVEPAAHLYELDLNDGQLYEVKGRGKEGKVSIDTGFVPLESRLFIAAREAQPDARPRPKKKRRELAPVSPCPDEPCRFELEEDNLLLLDTPAWQVAGEERQEPLFVLQLDDRLRQRLGVSPRGGAMVQPWVSRDRQPAGHLALTLDYAFTAETLPQGCRLALEQPELFRITLNGVPVETPDGGFWCDHAIRTLALPDHAFVVGENHLQMTMDYHDRLPGLEAVYLLGRFGVKPPLTLTALPDTLRFGDWCQQGLPYFAGNLTYVLPVTRPLSQLVIDRWRGVALAVAVNDGPWQMLGWPPYAAPVSAAPGDTLRIRVLGHRRNALGPFFTENKWPAWTGPAQFKDYTRSIHQLVPCGIMTPPAVG